jgi:hypothetical protein
MSAIKRLSRREVLRGAMAGAAIGVGLPLLECFLDVNGTALAGGAPLPTRFATWFWGLGLYPGRWEPKEVGSLQNQPLGPELVALERVKDKINIYSAMKVHIDGRPSFVHFTGNMSQLCGTAPRTELVTLPTIDTLIADSIGTSTRFRSLEASCTGNARTSFSYRAGGVQQPSQPSPAELYARIFGTEFKDPNTASFTPDPAVMARQSVLTAVKDQRQNLARNLGAADRARLDEYFTSLRQLEHQVTLQLEKPAPLEACQVMQPVKEAAIGTEVETTIATNKLMAQLLAHAFACDQTRVFNIAFSDAGSGLRILGDPTTHHTYSHEEPIDRALGYQRQVSAFSMRAMEGLATLIDTLDSVKEGDGTLLDRTLVLATTDSGFAKIHALENIPIITAGRAGGAMRTGLHVVGRGDPTTRVSLTVMQALKMPVSSWGTDSMETSKPVSEVLI